MTNKIPIQSLIYEIELQHSKCSISKKLAGMLLILLSLVGFSCHDPAAPENPAHKIIIEGQLSSDFFKTVLPNFNPHEGMKIQYVTFNHIEPVAPVQVLKNPVINRKIRWTIYSDKKLIITPQYATTIIINPGDSVHITYTDKGVIYSGVESDKWSLQNELRKINKSLEKPTKNSFTINSLEDYLNWNKYLDNKLAQLIPLIDSYKKKISPIEYDYYRSNTISQAEADRIHAFGSLMDYCQKDSSSKIVLSDLNAIWDSTQYKPWSKWLRSLSTYYGSIQNLYSLNRMEVWRKFDFDLTRDSLYSKELRTYLYYTTAKNQYAGLLREKLMTFILDEQTITEMGLLNPMTQVILKDYYSQPGYPQYKQLVRELENKSKRLHNN